MDRPAVGPVGQRGRCNGQSGVPKGAGFCVMDQHRKSIINELYLPYIDSYGLTCPIVGRKPHNLASIRAAAVLEAVRWCEQSGQDVSGAETPDPVLCKGTMLALHSAQAGVESIAKTRSFDELDEVVIDLTKSMDFFYYALGHHPRVLDGDHTTLRMHNYPKEWQESYDEQQLGISDPVHRASHRVAHGFRWRDAGSYVPMGERDEWMLAEARQHDIEDGWTIPSNLPGEPAGSVTFATRIGQPFPEEMIFYASFLGGLAYQQARIIAGEINVPDKPVVTDRQIEVAKLVCLDKSDKEIAKLLDVSPCTVTKHIRDMSARLKVGRRTALALRVVWAGYLCFPDVIPGGYQF